MYRMNYCTNPSISIAGLPRSGKNIWKMKFFPDQGKVREFLDGQGNLERTWKVREKSGKLKKKRLWQAVFRKFILFKRVKDVLSQR